MQIVISYNKNLLYFMAILLGLILAALALSVHNLIHGRFVNVVMLAIGAYCFVMLNIAFAKPVFSFLIYAERGVVSVSRSSLILHGRSRCLLKDVRSFSVGAKYVTFDTSVGLFRTLPFYVWEEGKEDFRSRMERYLPAVSTSSIENSGDMA